jgi:hypothetical protein
VRKLVPLRPRWRQVSTTESNRSTNRLPASLAVPSLSFRFRQITPCLNARFAALLSGAAPLTSANIVKKLWH